MMAIRRWYTNLQTNHRYIFLNIKIKSLKIKQKNAGTQYPNLISWIEWDQNSLLTSQPNYNIGSHPVKVIDQDVRYLNLSHLKRIFFLNGTYP